MRVEKMKIVLKREEQSGCVFIMKIYEEREDEEETSAWREGVGCVSFNKSILAFNYLIIFSSQFLSLALSTKIYCLFG